MNFIAVRHFIGMHGLGDNIFAQIIFENRGDKI